MMRVQIFKRGRGQKALSLEEDQQSRRQKNRDINIIAPRKVIGIFASHEKILLYSFL